MTELFYSSTKTYYIPAENGGGLLVDTGYAGTLHAFFGAIKSSGISIKDIGFLLATHYHPDHCGLIGELQTLGVTLIIADVQLPFIHFSDRIFERDGLPFTPINSAAARVISLSESRGLLKSIGIEGELLHTPSHSEDSVSLLLNNGDCFVGDLEPAEYIPAYGGSVPLGADWRSIMSRHPRRIFYAHANEKVL